MQDQAAEHVIRKRPLAADARRTIIRLPPRLRGSRSTSTRSGLFRLRRRSRRQLLYRLHAQRGGEDELAHRGREAGQEGVEWLKQQQQKERSKYLCIY